MLQAYTDLLSQSQSTRPLFSPKQICDISSVNEKCNGVVARSLSDLHLFKNCSNQTCTKIFDMRNLDTKSDLKKIFSETVLPSGTDAIIIAPNSLDDLVSVRAALGARGRRMRVIVQMKWCSDDSFDEDIVKGSDAVIIEPDDLPKMRKTYPQFRLAEIPLIFNGCEDGDFGIITIDAIYRQSCSNCTRADTNLSRPPVYFSTKLPSVIVDDWKRRSDNDAVALHICKVLCELSPSTPNDHIGILVFSESGHLVLSLKKYPQISQCPLVCLTASDSCVKMMNLVRNCEPVKVDSFQSFGSVIDRGVHLFKSRFNLEKGKVLIVKSVEKSLGASTASEISMEDCVEVRDF